jgi:NitT/TauT family transport system ATP-binding protein
MAQNLLFLLNGRDGAQIADRHSRESGNPVFGKIVIWCCANDAADEPAGREIILAFIAFRDVSKSFLSQAGRRSLAVSRFSFELEKGEFFCLLGPSGCGKTTVLSMAAGFERPSDGEILLEGKPITGPARDRGVVFQGDDSLYPWLTALENVAFGPKLAGQSKRMRREKAFEYLRLVGLAGQHDKHPQELSGGMKQRIQIARALANEPRMLLMDEPFGALDAQTRSIMQQELRGIWRAAQSPVLFITHDLDEAILLGGRIGVMTAGPGGTLKGIVPVDLPEERSRATPGYIEIYTKVHEMIREEVTKAALAAMGAHA